MMPGEFQKHVDDKSPCRPLFINTKSVDNYSTVHNDEHSHGSTYQKSTSLLSSVSHQQSQSEISDSYYSTHRSSGKTNRASHAQSASGSSNVSPVGSTSGGEHHHRSCTSGSMTNGTKVATPAKDMEAAINAFIGFDEDSDGEQTPIGTPRGTETDHGFMFDDIDQVSDSDTPPFSGPALEPKERVDTMRLQQLMSDITKYAERLHGLHKHYRIQYAAKEKFVKDYEFASLNGAQASLQLQEEIGEVNKQMNEIVHGMYEHYLKMTEDLREMAKYPLDFKQERFVHAYQMYCDDFAKTQAHLIQAGAQQTMYQQRGIVMSPHFPAATTPSLGYVPYGLAHPSSTSHVMIPAKVHRSGTVPAALAVPFVEQTTTPHYTQAVILPTVYQSMTPHIVNHRHYQQTMPVAPHSAPRGSSNTSSSSSLHFDFGKMNAIHQQQAMQAMNEHIQKIIGSNSSNSSSSSINEGNDKIVVETAKWTQMEETLTKWLSGIVPPAIEVKALSARVCQSLCNVLKGEDFFKDGKVVSYGASEQHLFFKDSNYNFCFCSPNLQLKTTDAIQLMADLMKKHTVFDKVQWAICNNRPVLTFLDTKTSAKCELVINMTKEIGSSRFIAAYASIDARFRSIAIFIKHWAHQHKLFKGLSSYALLLLVISYLQQKRVLPIISTTVEESGESEWSRRDDYEININKYREFASKQTDPSARLLVGFFHHFGFKFDYQNSVVSVRTGSNLKKIEKKWIYSSKKNQFAIEDPLDSATNLGRMIDNKLLHAFQLECSNVYQRLCDTQDLCLVFGL